MSRSFRLLLSLPALTALSACSPDYSPNTYAANAVQQANKVEPAIVVGFRQVEISASGTVGAVTGGAAGGILGSQIGPTNTSSALGAVGGTVLGSILGTSIEHASADTTGWEYIVRKPNGDLVWVTQREPKPLPLGQKVLVITGTQARIVADYSTDLPAAAPAKDKPSEPPPTEPAPAARVTAPLPPAVTATPLPPPEATGAPIPLTPPEPAAAPEPVSEPTAIPPDMPAQTDEATPPS